MEGVASEAASLAGHLKLGKFIYLYDNNHMTLSASTHLAFTEDSQNVLMLMVGIRKWLRMAMILEAIDVAIEAARQETERPSLILIKTHIGYGSPHKHDTFEAHGSPLGVEEVKLTKQNLGWPEKPHFYIPRKAEQHFRKAIPLGRKIRKKMG